MSLHRKLHPSGGFTLIELMIVISIVAILLTLALPVYSNYTIRAKIAEGLSVAMSAKTAASSSCVEDPAMDPITNSRVGYAFTAGTDGEDYVHDVQVTGSCGEPVITITTKNTGQIPDPVLAMNGEFASNSGQIQWKCSSSNTPDWLLPNVCRSSP